VTRNYISRLLCGDNVKVSLLVWHTWYNDTFCNAVDCRFELALEVQRWTRARSECLPGGGGKNYSYATDEKNWARICNSAGYAEETDTNSFVSFGVMAPGFGYD